MLTVDIISKIKETECFFIYYYSQGEIYKLNPMLSDKIVKVLDIFSGNFLAAEFLNTDRNICVVNRPEFHSLINA